MKRWLMDRNNRKWLYLSSLAVVPLLVSYGVITQDSAPLWIALLGAVVAPGVALTHLSPVPADVASAPEDFDEKDF